MGAIASVLTAFLAGLLGGVVLVSATLVPALYGRCIKLQAENHKLRAQQTPASPLWRRAMQPHQR